MLAPPLSIFTLCPDFSARKNSLLVLKHVRRFPVLLSSSSKLHSLLRGFLQLFFAPFPQFLVLSARSLDSNTYKLENERLESPVEKDMGVWVDGKQNISQQCPGSQKG